MTVRIQVYSDFICPWCYIGERRLTAALASLPEAIDCNLNWLPFELNPTMPPEGMARRDYRSAKFGSWQNSLIADARTIETARDDDIVFNYDRIARTPNTFMTHRLVWYVTGQQRRQMLIERIFRGYFTDGLDIGRVDVLLELAEAVGVDRTATSRFLSSERGNTEVRQKQQTGLASGISGVPYFIIGNQTLAGAQPVAVLRQAIEAGQRCSD